MYDTMKCEWFTRQWHADENVQNIADKATIKVTIKSSKRRYSCVEKNQFSKRFLSSYKTIYQRKSAKCRIWKLIKSDDAKKCMIRRLLIGGIRSSHCPRRSEKKRNLRIARALAFQLTSIVGNK